MLLFSTLVNDMSAKYGRAETDEFEMIFLTNRGIDFTNWKYSFE